MATVNFKTGALKQDRFLVVDYSNAVTPFFQNGGIASGELRNGADYNDNDTIQIDIPAATKVIYASFQTPNGTVITHTRSSTTSPPGLRLSISAGTNSSIYFFIVYQV